MPDNIEFLLGQMSSTMESMSKDIIGISCDVKSLLSDNATTKERLLNGTKRFEDHEVRITTIEARHFPWGKIGTILGLGFVILGLLIGLK
jgi:hypothetical protein